MRKLGPAFILTTLVALASGSAFALGDKNKNKEAPRVDATATQSATATTSGTTAATGGKAANEACKNLTPNEPAWQQHKCGETSAAITQKGGSGASAGEGSGAAAGGSGSAGSSGAGK